MMGVIACVSEKGGSGKSVIASHAAGWLAERGRSVAVIDCDPQEASATWLAAAAPNIQVHRIVTADDVISRVPAIAADVDDVVADGPAGTSPVTRALMVVSDLVIIPVCPSAIDLRAAVKSVRVIREAREVRDGSPRAVLVLNRARSRYRLTTETAAALKALGEPVAKTHLRLREAYADASGQSSFVWRMGYTARPAADEITKLFREVLR